MCFLQWLLLLSLRHNSVSWKWKIKVEVLKISPTTEREFERSFEASWFNVILCIRWIWRTPRWLWPWWLRWRRLWWGWIRWKLSQRWEQRFYWLTLQFNSTNLISTAAASSQSFGGGFGNPYGGGFSGSAANAQAGSSSFGGGGFGK